MTITANVGPSMIIWITVGALLSTCKHLGRQTVADINKFFQPVYKLKCNQPDEPVLLKSLCVVPGYTARCRISQQILVAAQHAKVKCMYIDSGCTISIINDASLL
eukprot:1173890-Rhodomonas_salina.1